MPAKRHHDPTRPIAGARGATRHAIRRTRDAARGAVEALASLVYPDLCLGCDRRIPARPDSDALSGLPLCPTCLAALPTTPSLDDTEALAQAQADGTIQGAVALWAYDAGGTVRRIQHALKYSGRERLGLPLGRLLGAAVRQSGAAPVDLVIPVPLASVRLLERGYNQSAGLAAGAAEALQTEVRSDRLVRTRATRSQTALSSEARRANVDGAFSMSHADDLAGRHVLLVDDVLTTGATLVAAAQPLADAGARVSVAVMASVV